MKFTTTCEDSRNLIAHRLMMMVRKTPWQSQQNVKFQASSAIFETSCCLALPERAAPKSCMRCRWVDVGTTLKGHTTALSKLIETHPLSLCDLQARRNRTYKPCDRCMKVHILVIGRKLKAS
eukprot:758185-Hanusia_phi.AAC.2